MTKRLRKFLFVLGYINSNGDLDKHEIKSDIKIFGGALLLLAVILLMAA